MRKLNRTLFVVILVAFTGGTVLGVDWKVGEKWTYKHEGPRPYGDGTGTVQGDRTVEVTAIKGEGAEKRYLLKNLWGTADVNPTTTHIDPNNMLHKLDVEGMGIVTLDPPVPTIWRLKVGEEKVVKTELDFGGFAMPIEYVAKRLKDETLTVPAGEFKHCQHIQIISTLQGQMGEPMKNKTDIWYHPKVKNTVKEAIITHYQTANSYTSTDVLKSHTDND